MSVVCIQLKRMLRYELEKKRVCVRVRVCVCARACVRNERAS